MLRRLGWVVPEEKIFTSGEATVITLRKLKPGARVYRVGTPPLAQEFRQDGIGL
jgi:ribonucleotide monophosphatase NagD (HAD superfamily)